MVTEQEDKDQEEQKVQAALQSCGYPLWTFKKVKFKMIKPKTKILTKTKLIKAKAKEG